MVYVDKTAYIHTLLDIKARYYFIARPRRFGKSLFLDTLEAFFSNKRTLFKGLAIDGLIPGEWNEYPVIRLDLSGKEYINGKNLENSLLVRLNAMEKAYGIEGEFEDISDRFENLIVSLSEKFGRKVVVLIDEYDSPLTSAIDNPELQEIYQTGLHGFYSVLKKAEKHLHFCFITGVTRYGKVSVFSGLNNLEDLTFNDEFAGLCGVTEEELHRFYEEGVLQYASKTSLSPNEVYGLLKFNYDGYHFTESLLDVYNPYSLNKALYSCKIKDYWSESGAPTLLVKVLMNADYDIKTLQGVKVKESDLRNLSVYHHDPIPLFFQTGYLTIKEYNPRRETFTLGYPNREVETGILNDVLSFYKPSVQNTTSTLNAMIDALENGEPEGFVNCLKSYFAAIPPELKRRVSRYENYYHTVIYCLLSLLGLETRAEYGTGAGYIDLVIRTQDYVYVIELKLNGSANDALEQIERKNYCAPFMLDPRKLYSIGLGFSKEIQNIDSFIIVDPRGNNNAG